jgi:pimeloyl-ACP methyl ester carboxylesterase
VKRYPIDPNRVYVGGFSGGARVAEKVAFAYPEVFKAALIHSSADPVGSPELALPPPDLWRLAQARTRVVFLTGSSDLLPKEMAEKTTRSLRHWCLYDSESQLMPWRGHNTANAAAFDAAFAALESHAVIDRAQQRACLADRDRDLQAALGRTRAAVAGADKAAAKREVLALDGAFGGLAAPDVIELADRCACGIFEEPARP